MAQTKGATEKAAARARIDALVAPAYGFDAGLTAADWHALAAGSAAHPWLDNPDPPRGPVPGRRASWGDGAVFSPPARTPESTAARDYVVEQLEREEENAMQAERAEKNAYAQWRYVANHAWLNALDGDPVNGPSHYTEQVPGIEAIQVTEHFNFNLGNAIKYCWRSGSKGKQVEDLRKAAWYINREIARLETVNAPAGRGHGDHFGYEETS